MTPQSDGAVRRPRSRRASSASCASALSSSLSTARPWATTTFPAGVTITDRTGKPVSGLTVTAHLVRPVSTAFDQRLTLAPEASGTYGADVMLPGSGAWELRLSAAGGKANWQTTQRIFVK